MRDGPEEELPKPLDAARATRLASQTVLVLDLRGEEDRPLRETRGVVLDPDGVVLCRFRQLLGAHRGTCRLPADDVSRTEVLGLAYSDLSLDLALLRVGPVGDPLPAMPVFGENPAAALRPRDPLFVYAAPKARAAAVAESYYLCADRVVRLLLAPAPAVPADAFLAMDAYGFLVGLVRIEANGGPIPEGSRHASGDFTALVDPVYTLVPGIGRPATMTLRDVTARFYDGTFQDLAARGDRAFRQRRWREAIDALEQALARVSLDYPEDEEAARVTLDLRESYIEETRRLAAGNRLEEAAVSAEAALGRFQGDGAFLVLLGEARVAQGNWAAGIEALLEARQAEPSVRVDGLLEKAYLELATGLSQTGDARGQETALLGAIQSLPSSGPLHLELAKLYIRHEAFDDATRLLQRVRELDAALRTTAEGLLGRIDDILKRRDAVVVPIPAGSRSIRAEVTVDGHKPFPFTIDTGAMISMIPESLALDLGYETRSPRLRRIAITGVSGGFVGPLIRLESLSLGGYAVRNMDVVVAPTEAGTSNALLGIDFLKHFKYTIDAAREEFRLERP